MDEDKLHKNILQSGEIELYIQNLHPSDIENIGTPLWFEAHHRLQKLNQQSAIEADEMREECVTELIISYGKVIFREVQKQSIFNLCLQCLFNSNWQYLPKSLRITCETVLYYVKIRVPVLIHEAICIQVWREKIFCQIIKSKYELQNTFIPYVILFHEITAVSLLQNVLYHKDSLKGGEDMMVDLIDYCASEITKLLSEDFSTLQEHNVHLSNMEEIKAQSKIISFNIGMSSICILRYLIEFIDELPISAISRIYKTHDVPLLMSSLIQMAPWRRTNPKTNIVQVFEDRSWKNIDKVEGISKYEGQCWIALRFLVLDVSGRCHYDINDFRKQHLIKVQKYLNEKVIDQIPPLTELNQFLNHLALTTLPSHIKKPLVMETIPEIKSNIIKEYLKKMKKITNKHVQMIFNSNKEVMMEIAKRLGETYDLDHLERLSPEGPICSNCGDAASKRCSKCKNEWYCGRECQVKRWQKHKNLCGIVSILGNGDQ